MARRKFYSRKKSWYKSGVEYGNRQISNYKQQFPKASKEQVKRYANKKHDELDDRMYKMMAQKAATSDINHVRGQATALGYYATVGRKMR